MPTAQPHLATWESRLLAAAIDASSLMVIGVFIYGALAMANLQRDALLPALALLYASYQSVSTLWPEFSIGRTVAGVVVLSYSRGGAPSVGQALARPLVRIAMLFAVNFIGEPLGAEWLVAVPFVVELALMAHTPWRRSVADRVANTMVVKRPPPQPHRAPAFPMYSAKDEEFGPKP